MAEGGDVQKRLFGMIDDNPVVSTPLPPLGVTDVSDCCFELPIFGNLGSSTNKASNDRTGFIKRYNKSISNVSLVLQKFDGEWVDQDDINNDDYGDFSDFGDYEYKGYKYISIYVSWRDILVAFGEGSYRIKTIEESIQSSVDDKNKFSFEYCLRDYTAALAEGTVRFDTLNSGILGDVDRRKKTFKYPDNYPDGIRIPAVFGNNKSSYEAEYTVYRDGSRVQLTGTQTETYVLDAYPMPADVHDFLKTNFFQASEIYVTDYNTNNANRHSRTKVVNPDGYEPRWSGQSKLASVSLEFEDAYDNKRKLNC